MTTKTNRYIEVSDILGLRFECKKCGTAVSFPVPNMYDYRRLQSCPNCKEPWTRSTDGSSIEAELTKAIEYLGMLRGLLHPESKFKTELSLFLEVPSDRASDSKA
jgi:hypothetical protein